MAPRHAGSRSAILRRRRALPARRSRRTGRGDDGWLAPDARLVSWAITSTPPSPGNVAASRRRDLAWLRPHRDQIMILAGRGPTTVSRVMAGAPSTTRASPRRAEPWPPCAPRCWRERRDAAEAEFLRASPDVATPGFAARDYNAFTSRAARALQRLSLRRGRMHLALVVHALDGTAALATHAGVTNVELAHSASPASAMTSRSPPPSRHASPPRSPRSPARGARAHRRARRARAALRRRRQR